MKCGKPIEEPTQMYCKDCNESPKAFRRGKSLWVHQGEIKDSIYRFKYKNRRIYAKEYGRVLADTFQKEIVDWKIDCVMPVPIHKKRKKARGYNQSLLLATEMVKHLKIELEVCQDLVIRKKNTRIQKVLDNKKRSLNLVNAFEMNETKRKIPQNILIIDDIYTTGATINEVSKVLVNNGVENVYFLTISIGQGF